MENTSDVIEEAGGYLCGKKREKQPLLIDVYSELISQYWDYTKNNIPNLNLSKLRLKSGKKAWFKCHSDGNEWQSHIHIIIGRQWSKGKSGCRVCNGTARRAECKQNEPIGVEFPDEVDKYWLYEANTKREIDPLKLTSSSRKKAWFKCPIDGHKWEASMASVKSSWRKGNSGCPSCNKREKQPLLIAVYSEFISQYWDYAKNNTPNLNLKKLTLQSNKKAWFKCPTDGHEWQVQIYEITTHQWSKGKSGCRVCNGTSGRAECKQNEPIGVEFSDEVDKYWLYETNTKRGLDPLKLTGSSRKKAWFKCPIDGHEWGASMASVKSSWVKGNSGCPSCRSHNLMAIRQFVASLEFHIPHLTQAELYKIFEQSGVFERQSPKGLKIVKDIINGKLTGQKLRDVIQGKEYQAAESETDSVYSLNADDEIQISDTATASSISFDRGNESQDNIDKSDQLPKIKVQKSLEFLNSKIVASADQEAIDFFIASKRNRIWAEVFEDESAVEAIEAFTDDGYGRQVRDQFLDEYYQARDMVIFIRLGIPR